LQRHVLIKNDETSNRGNEPEKLKNIATPYYFSKCFSNFVIYLFMMTILFGSLIKFNSKGIVLDIQLKSINFALDDLHSSLAPAILAASIEG